MPKIRSFATSSPVKPCTRRWRARRPADRILARQIYPCSIDLLTSRKKSMDPDGFAWRAVLAATGQPRDSSKLCILGNLSSAEGIL